ncbi:MAG: CCA tRNA nucleotidyltransferase [Alphaproteobacteria bacterium]|jgi:poly(A) polymerase|nr:CCA tRNA nucleotidyltransferase [Alphaproteobacteria bacterium]
MTGAAGADSPDPPRLPPAAWLDAEATHRVIAALAAAGGAPRFVGGCVRDTLLGRSVGDVDIATPLRPQAVLSALREAGIKALPTGLDHGTVTAVVKDGGTARTFEITTLRVDVETDGRHAVVAFTDDWRADAARRDFTMNALSAEPDGTLHDYFGGVADARAGRVRFVGDPATRLEEDVLRLLRFFRFAAHYARTPPDPEALAACRAYAPRLKSLSGERIRVELLKLLAAPDPAPVWRLMAETGAARVILGWPGAVGRLGVLTGLEAAADPIRRLAALLDGRIGPAEALAERIRLSNAERERLTALVARSEAVTPDMGGHDLRRLAYRFGRARAEDLVLLAWAAAPAAPGFAPLLAEARRWQPPAFPLKGHDVLALGVPPGPHVGRLLAAVEDWWIAGDFSADREACLAQLRRLAA